MAHREHLWSGYVHAVQEATIRTTVAMDSMSERARARAELVHAGSSALISQVFDALARTTVEQVSSSRRLTSGARRRVRCC